uniref:Predicted protein n=1 Tax=Hordeum vulgare subsp. vulgare TaxID=112509 RepID=F2E4Y1_HORVV|nr:predicted protein [Hordeum vulgare subsp. vulgare]
MWVIVVIEAVAVAALVLYLYHIYASYDRRPWYVTAAVLVGWYASFSLVVLIPTDVTSTRHEDCLKLYNSTSATKSPCEMPWLYLSNDVRRALWEVLYWTTFVTTWAVYPMMQEYTCAGDFTPWEKLKTAIRENLIFYGIAGGIGIVGLIYIGIAQSLTAMSLYSLVIGLSNTWGLFLLMFFIGHGCVEIPRNLWHKSNNALQLRYLQYELAALDQSLADADAHLTKIMRKIRSMDQRCPQADPHRPYVDKIISHCPPQFGLMSDGAGHTTISYSNLVKIHMKLMRADHNARLNKAIYEHVLRRALDLQDVLDSVGESRIKWTVPPQRYNQCIPLQETAEFYWHTYVRNWSRLFAFFICIALSVTLVWCEVTFFYTGHDLSLYSLMVHSTSVHDVSLQLLVFVPVLYMCTCSTWSLFSLRFFNFYRLIPNQHTDSASLIFSATYLSRLTAPLVYNFMNIIHISDSAFVKVMGQGVVLETFNQYFPIVVLLICLATFFRLYQRALEFFDAPQFQFDDDFHHDNIDTGRDILVRERARLTRRAGPRDPVLPLHKVRGHAHKNSDSETKSLVTESWQDAEERLGNDNSLSRIISRVKTGMDSMRIGAPAGSGGDGNVQYGTSL